MTDPARLAKVVTIPAMAQILGKSRRTMFWRLMRMHRVDREMGAAHAQSQYLRESCPICAAELAHGGWIFRPPNGAWKINTERLAFEHPEMFGIPSPKEMHETLMDTRGLAVHCRRLIDKLQIAFNEHAREHERERQRSRKRNSEPPSAA